jgi:preprotein translocase subunit SecY
MIVILFGLILFIVPGIVAGVALLFTSYLIIDRDLGPVDAMKESLRITNGHRWNIVLFLLLATGLNILGALFFGIGLLVTIPVSALALVHIYRWLLDPPTETGIEVSLPVKIITVFAIAVIFIGTALLIFGIIRGFLNDSELRDAQRRTDVSYIKESADSYFDSYGTYPESVALLVPDFISYVPTDPITQVPYEYLLREAGNDFEVCTILENDEFGGIYCEFGVELGANAVDQ